MVTRRVLLFGSLVLGILACSNLFALDPTLDISQYAHKSWKIREGFTQGFITSIAQTSDGYLWLGTEFGLVRFDGVRAVPWQPPAGQPLPNPFIRSLLATKDGTLWIGTLKGLASLTDGKLISHGRLASFAVDTLLQDRTGKIWVGALGLPHGRLCEIDNNVVEVCHGEDGSFGRFVEDLYEDSKGNVWAAASSGLWRWKPGRPQLYLMKRPAGGRQSIIENEDGTLLVIAAGGIQKLIGGKFETYTIQGRTVTGLNNLFRDRDGGLWIGSAYAGLIHVYQGKADVFSQSDGLSADYVNATFEDREGNIWVATSAGLDRFRAPAVSTISSKQGLSNETTWSALATNDGSVWIGTGGGLNIWKERMVRVRSASSRSDIPLSLFQDRRGRIWIVKIEALGYLDDGRFVPISGAPGGQVRSIAEDANGNLWFCNIDHGLVQVSPKHEVQIIPWKSLGHDDFATAMETDLINGGLWIGFYEGGILHLVDGRVSESYPAANGIGESRINALHFDNEGKLWISTEGGLTRLVNGRFVTLTRNGGLPCDGVNWTIEDDNGAFWLYMPCALVRVMRSTLNAWAAATEDGSDATPVIEALILDASDGFRGSSGPSGYFPTAAKSADGKLWFVAGNGVSVVDPLHLPFNKLAPPVRVEQILADRKPFDLTAGAGNSLRLPSQTGDVVIEYTALSFSAPEKTRFSYKLEGHDRDWQDAGTRRFAPYGGLSPGFYRFRVRAANESGLWNEEGAFVDFSVEPAYYQTTWFRLSVIAAVLVLFAGLYRLRLRQVNNQYNIRLEERVNERTRIARDLHDTLLQSFQGVLLKFHAITYLLPERGADAKTMLDTTIEEARRAVTEGRDTVQALRSSTIPGNNLAVAIGAFGDELATNYTGAERPSFQIQVEGSPRELAPIVKDEIFRIACEALRNAFHHAEAKSIEVEIRYDRRQFRLRVRDDGKGMSPDALSVAGRAGHYGIAGMHERAKVVGGKFSTWSKVGAGTEIELILPGRVAYAKGAGKPSS